MTILRLLPLLLVLAACSPGAERPMEGMTRAPPPPGLMAPGNTGTGAGQAILPGQQRGAGF